MQKRSEGMHIVIVKNGPYLVKGGVPLVRKSQVVSEYGEPLTWRKDGTMETPEGEYSLCRCGQSKHKPFCDGTHRRVNFEGTESADPQETAKRRIALPSGPGLEVRKDATLCMNSGFCRLRQEALEQLASRSGDTGARLLAISMVEHCPSGSLAYSVDKNGADIEPDLPQEISDTTEITSSGPIAGPLWVTGGIPIERSDGQRFETRNRVTLCNCGHSSSRPLCDGTHRREARRLGRMRSDHGQKAEGAGGVPDPSAGA